MQKQEISCGNGLDCFCECKPQDCKRIFTSVLRKILIHREEVKSRGVHRDSCMGAATPEDGGG